MEDLDYEIINENDADYYNNAMYNGMTAMSIIKLMPTRKEEIASFHSAIKNQLLNNEVSPLELLSNLKVIEKTIKSILSDNKLIDVFLEAMGGDKSRNNYGCKFEEAEVGTTYDYSVSSDWQEVSNEIKELEKKRKTIESMLKKASPRVPYIDNSTGEAIFGIPKESKTTVKVTIKQ
jgi:hypothetical protein